MKKLLTFLGLRKKEMTLDEYIISIRPKTRELSHTYTVVTIDDYKNAQKPKSNEAQVSKQGV